jgi:hypothetical protein
MSEQMEFVEVGESKYRVIKMGRAQAEQVLELTRWFSKHGMKAIREVQAENGNVNTDNGIEFLTTLLEHLTVDAVIDLFQAVTGCTKEEAEVYFDIATLVDVTIAIYEGQPAVKRLIERFFSQPSSTSSSVESSTISEQPTDGQTTQS